MTDGVPIGQDHSQDEGRETPVVPVPSVPRNDRRLVVGALMIGGGAVALVALLILGAFTLFNGSQKHDIHGTMTLTDGAALLGLLPGFSPSISDEGGGHCHGMSGFDDMQAGAQVVVKNGGGTVIGTSRLDDGETGYILVPSPGPGVSASLGPDQCVFSFTVKDLPDSDFYAVSVSHRGEIQYSRQDLEGANWEVGLSLGK